MPGWFYRRHGTCRCFHISMQGSNRQTITDNRHPVSLCCAYALQQSLDVTSPQIKPMMYHRVCALQSMWFPRRSLLITWPVMVGEPWNRTHTGCFRDKLPPPSHYQPADEEVIGLKWNAKSMLGTLSFSW